MSVVLSSVCMSSGGVLAGVVSDKLGMRATTCAVMLLLAAPTVSVQELRLESWWCSSSMGFDRGLVNGSQIVVHGLLQVPHQCWSSSIAMYTSLDTGRFGCFHRLNWTDPWPERGGSKPQRKYSHGNTTSLKVQMARIKTVHLLFGCFLKAC